MQSVISTDKKPEEKQDDTEQNQIDSNKDVSDNHSNGSCQSTELGRLSTATTKRAASIKKSKIGME
jgi:hypothetical protein